MICAALFDFNGTMVFDDAINEAAWRRFIEEKIARPLTDEEFQKEIQGRNAGYTLRYFLGGQLTDEECRELEESKEVIYRRLTVEKGLTLAPGMEEFLDYLKERKIPVNIGTAAGPGNVRFFFEYYGLGRWFDPEKVVYNNGRIKGKPEPDIYIQAAEKISRLPAECAVFEDSESGLEAARRAGAGAVIRLNPMHNDGMNPGRITAEFRDYKDAGRLHELFE